MRADLLLAALLLAGCAALKNTPQQDQSSAAWAACKAEGRTGNLQLIRVEPDGRYWFSYSAGGYEDAKACMAEQFAKMRRTVR